MRNLQVIEKRVISDGQFLDVVDIFLTVQGEGPYTGERAVFVRLAGCVLQCPLCDTDYTSGRKVMSVKEIEHEVLRLIAPYDNKQCNGWGKFLVVLTGGEPLRQPCGPLIRQLVDDGLQVQIETNGMVNDKSLVENGMWYYPYDIVCSPKGKIDEELRSRITILKYVIKAGMVDETDGLPTRALDLNTRPERPWDGFGGKIFVQPCDEGDVEKNKANMAAAVNSCIEFGYILGVQLHKYAELR